MKVNLPGVERFKKVLPPIVAGVIVVCALGIVIGWLGWILFMARNSPSVVL